VAQDDTDAQASDAACLSNKPVAEAIVYIKVTGFASTALSMEAVDTRVEYKTPCSWLSEYTKFV
jgi:hypothetical protein